MSMTVGDAIVLGIVEGITEYLPVSSTGHLLLVEHLLGIGIAVGEKEAADAYAILIQGGAILAVVWLYWARIRMIVSGVFVRRAEGRMLALQLLAAFMPAAVIGLLFEKRIKEQLFGLPPVVLAWFVGGIVILLFSRQKRENTGRELSEISLRQCLLIGVLQCASMWPGVSRSLVTILGGLFVGLRISAAVEFSFLLGVVTLGAATSYEAAKHGSLIIEHFSLFPALLGFVFAFLSAVVAIKWMVSYLTSHSLAVFGYYRIALAVAVGGMIFIH